MNAIENLNKSWAYYSGLDENIRFDKSGELFYKPPRSPENIHGVQLLKKRHSRRLSHGEEQERQWRSIDWDQRRPMSSPNTLQSNFRIGPAPWFSERVTTHSKLFTLDNMLSQERTYSPPVFDTFYLKSSPTHDEEANGYGVPSPVSQSLLAVAKSKTMFRHVQT